MKAFEKAENFWRDATTGSRDFLHTAPILNMLVVRETVLPGVFTKVDLYLYLALYFLLVWYRLSFASDAELEHIFSATTYSRNILTALTSAMTFYLGFYNSSVWQRYDAQWNNTMIAYSRIADICIQLEVHVANAELRNNALRLVNLYHHLVYLDQGGVTPDDALRLCVARRLLTRNEAKLLLGMGCDVGERTLIWACKSVRRAEIDPMFAARIIDLICVVRQNASYIRAYDNQPIPFVYYHFMNLLVSIVLLVASVDSAAWTAVIDSDTSADGASTRPKWISLAYHLFLFLLYVISVLGMRELTIMLSDPFVHGRNAIPTSKYMDAILVKTSKHAAASHHDEHVVPDDDPGFATAHRGFQALGTSEGEIGASHDVNRRRVGLYHGLKDWEKRTRAHIAKGRWGTSHKQLSSQLLVASLSAAGRRGSLAGAPATESEMAPRRQSNTTIDQKHELH